ncbi:hypothetical protein C5167_009336 [Papaver somniferum]|uniref:Uncharacterized protein n=1 Tax=Papaver somniferum TaxID=3469 RepID=A0A4Y7K061_PAPSO|nr:hypothetical protein C5167_009336 [Papaver somniferum]
MAHQTNHCLSCYGVVQLVNHGIPETVFTGLLMVYKYFMSKIRTKGYICHSCRHPTLGNFHGLIDRGMMSDSDSLPTAMQFFVIGTSEYLATNKRWIQLDRTTKAAFYSIKMCWLLHSFFNGKLMLQLGETVMFIAEAITAKLLFRALIIDDSKAKLALGQDNSTMS